MKNPRLSPYRDFLTKERSRKWGKRILDALLVIVLIILIAIVCGVGAWAILSIP
jgi:hypothetical protein